MPKTIKIPKISLQRIPVEMSSGQPEQVVEKMEEEEAGIGKQTQGEVQTPTKRTTVKGSGAGPLSAKKKAQQPKSKPSKPVKVVAPEPQRMIEVVGTDGKLYTVPMPAAGLLKPEDDPEPEEDPESEEESPRRKSGGRAEQAAPQLPSRVQAKRAAKQSAQEREMLKAASVAPPALSEAKFKQYRARHPAPGLRTNLPAFFNVTSKGAWRTAISDDWDCLSMSANDVTAMILGPLRNVTLNLANRNITIAAGCMHVTHYGDPHNICVTGQFMAKGELCCCTKKIMCKVGKAALTADPSGYERWVKPRSQFVNRVKHKGGEAFIETLGPGIITGSLRLRAYYLEKFDNPAFKKVTERIEKVLAEKEGGEHVEVLKPTVAGMAKNDRKLAAPHSTVTKKHTPWFWTASVPEKNWKKLEGARTVSGNTAQVTVVSDEDMDTEEVPDPGDDHDALHEVQEEAKQEEEGASGDEDLEVNRKKKRKVVPEPVTPAKSDVSASSRKSRKSGRIGEKSKAAYQIRIKLKDSAQLPALDEMLARQQQFFGDEPDAEEVENLSLGSLGRVQEEPQQRAAASAASASFSRLLGSSSDSLTSETVSRNLFSPEGTDASGSKSAPKCPLNLSTSGRGATPQFVNPNAVKAQPRERREQRNTCRVKTSTSESYSGGTPTTGLMPSSDSEMFALIESTLAMPLSALEDGSEIAPSTLHPTIDECLQAAERAVQRKLSRATVELPVHLGVGVFKFQVTTAHLHEGNTYASKPTPVPKSHIPGTPDYLESESKLHTTYGAVTTQEHASRVAVNDLSLLLHLVEHQQRIIDTLEANTNMSDDVTDVISNSRCLTSRMKTCG